MAAYLMLQILWLFIAVTIKSQTMCVWNSLGDLRRTMNGNWALTDSQSVEKERIWYHDGYAPECDAGPNDLYAFWECCTASAGRWMWGPVVDDGNNLKCFCSRSDVDDPTTDSCDDALGTNYLECPVNTEENDMEIFFGSCPELQCDNIKITSTTNQDCDGFYDSYTVPGGDLNDINVYKKRNAEYYFWFDLPSFRWVCSTIYGVCKLSYTYRAERGDFSFDTVQFPGDEFQLTSWGKIDPFGVATIECEPPAPTPEPTTAEPSSSPTTADPTTAEPSDSPTTAEPSQAPTTADPTTSEPTGAPTDTRSPTGAPTTAEPTETPSDSPTTAEPTTDSPTSSPTTAEPTKTPSESPTKHPLDPGETAKPTDTPSETPTGTPTDDPSAAPTTTESPTRNPLADGETYEPTDAPSEIPTQTPTKTPTRFQREPTEADNVNILSIKIPIIISLLLLLFTTYYI